MEIDRVIHELFHSKFVNELSPDPTTTCDDFYDDDPDPFNSIPYGGKNDYYQFHKEMIPINFDTLKVNLIKLCDLFEDVKSGNKDVLIERLKKHFTLVSKNMLTLITLIISINMNIRFIDFTDREEDEKSVTFKDLRKRAKLVLSLPSIIEINKVEFDSSKMFLLSNYELQYILGNSKNNIHYVKPPTIGKYQTDFLSLIKQLLSDPIFEVTDPHYCANDYDIELIDFEDKSLKTIKKIASIKNKFFKETVLQYLQGVKQKISAQKPKQIPTKFPNRRKPKVHNVSNDIIDNDVNIPEEPKFDTASQAQFRAKRKKKSLDNEEDTHVYHVVKLGPNDKLSEKLFQMHLAEKEEESSCESSSIFGRIDIVSKNRIIEVKKYDEWKHAFGQVLAYSEDLNYEGRKRAIALYCERKDEQDISLKSKDIEIVQVCRKYDVEIIWLFYHY